jgi:hypothetical protein
MLLIFFLHFKKINIDQLQSADQYTSVLYSVQTTKLRKE